MVMKEFFYDKIKKSVGKIRSTEPKGGRNKLSGLWNEHLSILMIWGYLRCFIKKML
ncbi:MAG: hypothetical protein K5770_05330 [Lachnospiraceae bacterium]|nr:hypothetical protein [Lachnospiraceae bacterium]